MKLLVGDGVQYCLSPDNLGLVSECGSSGVQSIKSPMESLDKEKQFWWTDTNRTLVQTCLENISNAFVNVPDKLSQFTNYSYSYICLIVSYICGMLQSSAAILTSYLHSCFLKQLHTLVLPSLYGCSMVLFSWLLVYFDSKVPGVYPPTPVSPKKHRWIITTWNYYLILDWSLVSNKSTHIKLIFPFLESGLAILFTSVTLLDSLMVLLFLVSLSGNKFSTEIATIAIKFCISMFTSLSSE